MSGHIQHDKFLRTFFGESFLQIALGNFQWLHYGVYIMQVLCVNVVPFIMEFLGLFLHCITLRVHVHSSYIYSACIQVCTGII